MKNISLLLIFLSIFGFSQSQNEDISAIKKFQKELNEQYRNQKESPLRGDNFKNFTKHPFFPIDLKYKLRAKLVKTENAVPFDIPTSSGRTQPYIEYGKATFVLDGKSYVLTLFQNLSLMKRAGYENYLFLPFRDETKGVETYGGGKYIDLRIPDGDEIIIDFNQSYHPYCAYNAYDYNCPIVPEVNFLPIRIEAGVMYEDVYHH